ncbi:Oidioi.mRNA.OKI2018_I69.chr2.g4296.t1.cds [Oikopleura dioica]|uniref:Oidioi.mRNA.OKI2018_I69.chr2.g4296.t1.cds n=1 Tax=Oikopleura dioica TaxID=34765 RepID=A0ABN7T153_OIKDI|nr:Oidioi.mRNA.OKI2018_I69.chr2.g4296.t1.cds [Oikopleura dioica]
MTKIVDLMNAIIEIFNDHAGEDKMLSKEELMKMMDEEKDEMFSSEEISTALMAELDKNLDGKVSFDEFIKSMAFICALVKEGQDDSTDIPKFNFNGDPTTFPQQMDMRANMNREKSIGRKKYKFSAFEQP